MVTMIMMTMMMSRRLVINTPFLKLLQFKNPQISFGGSFKIVSLIFISIIFISCTSNTEQGVVSTNDLLSDTTVTTIAEEVVEEVVSVEDAQLLLARCLRENGYDINDPKNDESLRSVLQPVFLAADQKGREEFQETIQTCAEDNNIPIGGSADFENPEAVADSLDTQLEFAQCLRENGIEIEDPSAESQLRPLLNELVQSGQYLQTQIREVADICFDDLGIDPPQQRGG
ncbi:MAG: hypothetical protein L7T98_03740 [Candidatus Actinomarina sp.]|nr:hypothetical protein [Candidatus Actinomarina sp.]